MVSSTTVAGMRIAFIIRSLGIGGAERQMAVLARALAARGHAVLVVVYYDGGPLIEELRREGVTVVSLGKRGRWDLLGPLFRLRRAIRDFRPTIVHGYMADGNVVSLLAGRFMHPAAVVWGVRSSHYDFGIYDRFFQLLFRASCRLAGRADLIIANSVAGRDYHVSHGYPVDRSVVIPNGIDTERFRPDAVRRARQRREWGVPDDGILIGVVGRLDPMKDHPTFLRAAGLIAKRMPQAQFVVVGDGSAGYRAELVELAAASGLPGRIRWVPMAEDVPAVYNALDLFVSLSNSGEGFPNVIGEAMASGLRCVVTAMGDSERVLGGTGVLVPVGNPGAVADMCVRLCQDPGGMRAPEARQRVEAEFGVDALARRTEEALGVALARRAGRGT
jgi:glycosyltransferase involved in cell wall biosynthesis